MTARATCSGSGPLSSGTGTSVLIVLAASLAVNPPKEQWSAPQPHDLDKDDDIKKHVYEMVEVKSEIEGIEESEIELKVATAPRRAAESCRGQQLCYEGPWEKPSIRQVTRGTDERRRGASYGPSFQLFGCSECDSARGRHGGMMVVSETIHSPEERAHRRHPYATTIQPAASSLHPRRVGARACR